MLFLSRFFGTNATMPLEPTAADKCILCCDTCCDHTSHYCSNGWEVWQRRSINFWNSIAGVKNDDCFDSIGILIVAAIMLAIYIVLNVIWLFEAIIYIFIDCCRMMAADVRLAQMQADIEANMPKAAPTATSPPVVPKMDRPSSDKLSSSISSDIKGVIYTSSFIDPKLPPTRPTQSIGKVTPATNDPVLSWAASTAAGPGGAPGNKPCGDIPAAIKQWEFSWGEVEIAKWVGQGGFGTVYLGTLHEGIVAIKVLVDAKTIPSSLPGGSKEGLDSGKVSTAERAKLAEVRYMLTTGHECRACAFAEVQGQLFAPYLTEKFLSL